MHSVFYKLCLGVSEKSYKQLPYRGGIQAVFSLGGCCLKVDFSDTFFIDILHTSNKKYMYPQERNIGNINVFVMFVIGLIDIGK